MSEAAPFSTEPHPESFIPDTDKEKKKKKKRSKALVGGVVAEGLREKEEKKAEKKQSKELKLPKSILGVETEEPEGKEKAKSKNRSEKAEKERDEHAETAVAEESGEGEEATTESATKSVPEILNHAGERVLRKETAEDEIIIDLHTPKAIDSAEHTILSRSAAEVAEPAQMEAEEVSSANETKEDEGAEPLEAAAEVEEEEEPETPDEPAKKSRSTPTSTTNTVSSTSSVTPSSSSGSSGGGGRSTPAVPTSSGGTTPPVPPVVALGHTGGTPPPSFNVAPSASAAAPNIFAAELADAEYGSGRKRGRKEGLLAGLVLGGGIEHIRHKRREKRMEKAFAGERRAHDKKLEDVRWDAVRENEAAKARAAAGVLDPSLARPAERVISTPLTTSERAPQTASERVTPASRASAEQRSQGLPKPELSGPEKAREELRRAIAEQQKLDGETLDIEEGHRLERSAWHTVEVDEKGHAVEKPTFEYGHEYFKERSRETAPPDPQRMKTAAGGAAITAALTRTIGADGVSAAASGSAGRVSEGSSSQTAKNTESATRSSMSGPSTPGELIPWIIALVIIAAAIYLMM